jgi:hypothetical protein
MAQDAETVDVWKIEVSEDQVGLFLIDQRDAVPTGIRLQAHVISADEEAYARLYEVTLIVHDEDSAPRHARHPPCPEQQQCQTASRGCAGIRTVPSQARA